MTNLKNISRPNEQYMKLMPSRNRTKSNKKLAQDLRDASDHSPGPSNVHLSFIRNALSGRLALKRPFLNKVKQSEKAEVYQITQELD